MPESPWGRGFSAAFIPGARIGARTGARIGLQSAPRFAPRFVPRPAGVRPGIRLGLRPGGRPGGPPVEDGLPAGGNGRFPEVPGRRGQSNPGEKAGVRAGRTIFLPEHRAICPV
jgi:hypothetical protein